jgi:hypothetical protein
MTQNEENYAFPWGFHLGDITTNSKKTPLYTESKDGGFTLLYDKASEKSADRLLESLALELLSTMPYELLKISMIDKGRKKFYRLSSLQPIGLYEVAYDAKSIEGFFDRLEKMIIARHTELLCCNRQTIDQHNQKSRMKQNYHLVLLNIENFTQQGFSKRRIDNFLESAYQAGVYVIAFGNQELLQSKEETTQSILKRFKQLKVDNNQFHITPEIFEFQELLEEGAFAPLNIVNDQLMHKILAKADIESFLDPEAVTLEVNTKV